MEDNASIISYSEDSAIIANYTAEIQIMLSNLYRFSSEIGFKFDSSKCAALCNIVGKYFSCTVKIDDGSIYIIITNAVVKYLGIALGVKVRYIMSSGI